MPRSTQRPTINLESNKRETETHPAYSHIQACRVSGSIQLHGSDFVHQYYVNVRIYEGGTIERSLSNDYSYQGKLLVEVAMSEAQWATFVSSMNTTPTPCTLEFVRNRPEIPAIERNVDRKAQFGQEMAAKFKEAQLQAAYIITQIKESKLSQKAKDELTKSVKIMAEHISSNTQFVSDQFGEHIEHTVEKAKVDINAYALNLLHRAGLNALNAPSEDVGSPLRLPEEFTRKE
jgi:flagellar basal body P-ring protein FlgI